MLTEGPTEREAEIIGEHFAHLQALVVDGTVLVAGGLSNHDQASAEYYDPAGL